MLRYAGNCSQHSEEVREEFGEQEREYRNGNAEEKGRDSPKAEAVSE